MIKIFSAILLMWGLTANAETPPTRVVLPGGPGGGADILARKIANSLEKEHKFIMDNHPGADGILAINYIVEKPEENKIMINGITNLFLSDITNKDIAKFDYNSFAFIGALANITTAIVTNNSQIDVRDLIRNGGRYNVGILNASHRIALLMLTNGKLTEDSFSRYKGGGDALAGIMRKEIDLFFQPLASVKPFVASGRMMLLAVGADSRLQEFKDVPTFTEVNKDMKFKDDFVIVGSKNMSDYRLKTYRDIFAKLEHDQNYRDFLESGYLKFAKLESVNTLVSAQTENRRLYQKYNDTAK